MSWHGWIPICQWDLIACFYYYVWGTLYSVSPYSAGYPASLSTVNVAHWL